MKNIPWTSAISMVLALAFVAVVGCGGQSESGAAGDGEGGLAQEAAEGEHAEGAERAEGGEHAEGGGRSEGGEHDEAAGRGEEGEHREGGERGEGGEHAEGGEHGEEGEHDEGGEGEEGEESGEYIGRDESWDATRRGMKLMLSYDAERDAFVGTVENTTEAAICAVRVEVHLAGGPELGPTERQDVGAGESVSVELSAGGESFERWTAHPESSACGA